ncbi:unnamed protein product [Durusdinium trenchii]|uniref:WW domain-containing protein n=1 Tax=Durusdinium trenchii TaxID=1381693 RepID=A0ABP0HPD6_9DINO
MGPEESVKEVSQAEPAEPESAEPAPAEPPEPAEPAPSEGGPAEKEGPEEAPQESRVQDVGLPIPKRDGPAPTSNASAAGESNAGVQRSPTVSPSASPQQSDSRVPAQRSPPVSPSASPSATPSKELPKEELPEPVSPGSPLLASAAAASHKEVTPPQTPQLASFAPPLTEKQMLPQLPGSPPLPTGSPSAVSPQGTPRGTPRRPSASPGGSVPFGSPTSDFKTPTGWSPSGSLEFGGAGYSPAANYQDPSSPSGPKLGAHSVADQSLLAASSKAADGDEWRGWTIQTSPQGKLFYHHIASNTSQWQMPPELSPVLGEWTQVEEDGKRYWRNEKLAVSSWKDPRRTTNLFQAALDGNLFFLQLYTEVGGFLDAVDSKGRTALHYNCAGGSAQAVNYLLQHGASVDLLDRSGSTPLHWAARYGHAPIVRLLLESKAHPDYQNSMGDTAMHEAAALGLLEPLQWLVLAKANPTLRNRESRSPAEVADRANSKEVLRLLQELEGSFALDRQSYYTTASWWLDRAFFVLPTVTPWMRPGHFNYVDAQNLYKDFPQTFHPCGCYNPHGAEFCAGVQLAEGFGETTMGGAEPTGPTIKPPKWFLGTEQETAFNLYANHGGGYIYMLCKRDTFLQCRQDHLADPIRGSSQEQVDAYLKCIWDCFEANVLEFADTQWMDYQAQRDLNVTMKITSKSGSDTEPEGTTWRWIPIPDTTQISGGGEGLCSWDAVEAFSDAQVEQLFAEDFGPKSVCDAGPKNHNPNNWEVHDKVRVPNNLPPGEYLLSWRWDCYMADQIWSNCADVEIVDPNVPTTTTTSTTTTSGTGCVDEPLPAQ